MRVLSNSQNKTYLTPNDKIVESPKKCGMTISDFIGDIDESGTLQAQRNIIKPDFTGVKDLGAYALQRRFSGSTININPHAIFQDLEKISGKYAMDYVFQANENIQKVYFPKLKEISGYYAMNYAFATCPNLKYISFPELETISGPFSLCNLTGGDGGLFSIEFPKLKSVIGSSAMTMFAYANNNLKYVSFPELTTIIGNSAFGSSMYYNPKFVSASFPKLETIIGENVFSIAFQSNSIMETHSFPKLSKLYGKNIFSSAFASCLMIKDIYFNSLTTTSFGGNATQFNGMFNTSSMQTSGSVNIHFPSNLQSTISGLTGYPNFGATAGRVTLAFDLPATS